MLAVAMERQLEIMTCNLLVQVKRPASPDIIEVEREVRLGKSVRITPIPGPRPKLPLSTKYLPASTRISPVTVSPSCQECEDEFNWVDPSHNCYIQRRRLLLI